ncbi:MAG: DedA family protein, partial [Acidimicrobiales bacterium]
RGSKNVHRTTELVKNRGGAAVFIGRFVSVFRALTPGVAGVSGLRYRTFLLYNALGGVIWGIGYTLAGYFAGRSYQHFLKVAGTATTVAVIVVVVGFAAFVVVRKLRERRRANPGHGVDAGPGAGPGPDGVDRHEDGSGLREHGALGARSATPGGDADASHPVAGAGRSESPAGYGALPSNPD